MDEVSVGNIPAGSVVVHEGRRWLVLESWFGPPPFGFYAPWEMVLQPLPGGPSRTYRCTVIRRLEVVPIEFREVHFVCRQQGELLLVDPTSGEMITLPESRTRLDIDVLESGSEVKVSFCDGRPLWVSATST